MKHIKYLALGIILTCVSGLALGLISSDQARPQHRQTTTWTYTLLDNQDANTTGQAASIHGQRHWTAYPKYHGGTGTVVVEAKAATASGDSVWGVVDTWTATDDLNIYQLTLDGLSVRAKVSSCSSCDISLVLMATNDGTP